MLLWLPEQELNIFTGNASEFCGIPKLTGKEYRLSHLESYLFRFAKHHATVDDIELNDRKVPRVIAHLHSFF